jgi:predicted DNA-binding transcriptional regulator YafY
MAKADNLLAILWLLRARGRMTAAAIAEALELNLRTVYRYMDALSASGVPLIAEAGPEGGYRLADGFRGAPLFFTADELAALVHAARLSEAAGHPDPAALASALGKVEQTLTAEQEAELARHREALAVVGGQDRPAPSFLVQLERAAAGREAVIFTYRRPGGPPVERRVDPYAVYYRDGRWYLVGYCHLRCAFREFRVDRVSALRSSGERYEPDPAFRLTDWIGDDWIRRQVAEGPATIVRLRGAPHVIEALCTHWYLRHCLVEHGEREATFRHDPIGLTHLPGYLLTFGTALEVVEPESLRQSLVEMAQRWAEHHAQNKAEREDP